MSKESEAQIWEGYAKKHGCAWFIDSEDGVIDQSTVSGWYSVGGKDAVKFSSVKGLPSGIVWWTNLTKPQAWSFGRWSNIKDGGFFGPEWPTLMSEVGRKANDEQIAEAVKVWSEIFARSAEFLSYWSSKHTPEQPWDWGEGSLADALAPRLDFVAKEAEEPQVILKAAYIEKVDMEVPANALINKRKVILSFPRNEYVRKIWSLKFPKGVWSEVKNWPSRNEEKISWVRSSNEPLLIKVTIGGWRLGQENAGALWLGMRGRRFAAAEMEPIWITGEELSYLASFADLELMDAYKAEGWERMATPEGWLAFSEAPMAQYSITQSLLSESLWVAAASPTRDPKKRKQAPFSSRAVWWRAQDRFFCFKAAEDLQKKGITVLSYGQGSVTVLIDTSEKPESVTKAIVSTNLSVPMALSKFSLFDIKNKDNNIVDVDSWLKKSGGVQALMDVDRLVFPWIGPNDSNKVKMILENSVKSLFGIAKEQGDECASWWKKLLQEQAKVAIQDIKLRQR